MIIGMLAPAATTTATAAGDVTAGGDATSPRGRAGRIIATYDPAAPAQQAQAAPAPTSTSSPAPAPKEATRQQSLQSAAAVATTAESSCPSSLDLQVEALTDRTIVKATRTSAASLTLMRQRSQGFWSTLGTFAGSAKTYNDLDINPRVSTAYRMIAKAGDGTVLADCTVPYSGVWSTYAWGDWDAVVAHDTALVIQREWSFEPTPALTDGAWVTPTFSADGRLVAATRIDPVTGVGILEVRRSRTAALVFSVDLGPTVSVADPAFSFDGQTLAYSRYDTATGEPLGLGFVDVHGSHAERALTGNVPMAEPAWRPNGTLVVSTFGTSEGLANVCSTCTTVTPLPGTAGGYTAEVGPDNTVYFATADDSSSALKKISPAGSVSTLRTSATDLFISPRLSPSGQLFVEKDTPNTWSTDPTVTIISVAPGGPDGDQNTDIGRYSPSSYGYDIRQPQSKGTSDFVGDPQHDVITRDGYGKLWAYRSTDRGLGARTQIGSGWSTYTAVVPIGDLTSDDRADLLGRDAYGRLWLYPGIDKGKFARPVQMGTGWNSYTLVAPGDWNGDDKADLIARDSSGYLWLYPGNGTGRLGARTRIGSGWGAFDTILGSGDANFDNKADLLARDRYGRLWLYPGNGKGGFLAKRQIGSGWGAFTALTATEVTDQMVRVWARTSAGQLVYYTIVGDGTFKNGQFPLGYGWNGLLIAS